MRYVVGIGGSGILALVLVDAFNTIVLARRTRHMFRIARPYYAGTWRPFAAVGRRIHSSLKREAFLGVYGPLSLLMLFGLWATGLILAFGMLQWAAGMHPANIPGTFPEDLYLSASTLFTLSSGDPQNPLSKFISVMEGGLGFAFLGLVVGYLPVFYQSFSQRELRISLMDARAGSPPSVGELLKYAPSGEGRFEQLLASWEEWAAQVLENQISFPMLAYFRSQHSNQSWLTALVAMVDCAAIVSLAAEKDLRRQAELTFAMGRHVLTDIVVVFGLEDKSGKCERRFDGHRQTEADFAAIRKILRSSSLLDGRLTAADLKKRRHLYEPQAIALSDYFLMALPPWVADESTRGNWRVAIDDRDEVPFAVSDPFVEMADEENATKTE